MKKSKIVAIGVAGAVLAVIMVYILLYLCLYKYNDDEIVKFGSKIKINVDGDFVLYDEDTEEIIENVHFVCKASGKLGADRVKEANARVNMVSETFSNINYDNMLFLFGEFSDSAYKAGGMNHAYEENEKGEFLPYFSQYSFYFIIDKDDINNFYVKVIDDENQIKNYVLLRADDANEAKTIIEKIISD